MTVSETRATTSDIAVGHILIDVGNILMMRMIHTDDRTIP
jgi:hypothetical protein